VDQAIDTEIDYAHFVREALRDVPRQVLRQVQSSGLPGDHHFFVTFRTDHPETVIASRLKRQHPIEMTVVLQHQFSSLFVDEIGFSVTLRFGGRAEQIFVPFAALTAFADPAAQFGLRFEQDDVNGRAQAPDDPMDEVEADPRAGLPPEGTAIPPQRDGNVVEIGRFRRR
jgi:hypothetical protein